MKRAFEMPKCPICNRELNEKELQVHIKYYHKRVDVCPDCGGQIRYQEGCKMCPSCGWSKCA